MSLRMLVIIIFTWTGTVHAGENTSIQRFWSDFRQATICGNTEKVAKMTKFPLWVRGPDDSDPVIYYDRNKFPVILKKLLHQDVWFLSGGMLRRKTMLQVIKEKERIDQKDFVTANLVSIEQFDFEKINGRWQFTRAYFEE